MRYQSLIASVVLLFASSTSGMGVYDQDWITRVRLPLSMIQKIFGLLDFDTLS